MRGVQGSGSGAEGRSCLLEEAEQVAAVVEERWALMDADGC